jgi:hypothetical protein
MSNMDIMPAMDEPTTHPCKNCNTPITATLYCGQCGQIANTPRITARMMWQEFLRVYANIDKGLIFTFRQMLNRPGYTPRDYVEGKRIAFMKPLTFLAIGSAACTAAVRQYPKDFSPYFDVHDIPQTLLQLIPVGAIVSRMFIKDKRFNLWESMTLHAFVNFIFLALVAATAFALPKHLYGWFQLAIPPIYAIYQAIAHWQFYDLSTPRQLIKGTLSAALITILGLETL